MDIARPDQSRKRRLRRILTVSVSLLALAAVTIALSRMKPALPGVERGSLYFGVVKRGEMLLQVHGVGSLLPEEIRWVPAANQGRVENILVLPGTAVKADTILVELSNPELEQLAFNAQWELKGAEAELANLKVTLQSQQLNQQAVAATAGANYSKARLEAEVNEELSKDGLVPLITLKQSKANAEESMKLWDIEQQRYKIAGESAKAQVAVQEAKVEQFRAQYQLKRQQVESLKIRAGIDGVLQKLGDQLPLQAGQQLPAGANVARVANPMRLKAEIKIMETQAKDVQLQQIATIDTRNGVIKGRVTRIDPAVQNGTVAVDVALEGPLPKGARPDLTVEGVIELDRLDNVLYVGLPAHAQSDQKVGIFKVVPGGKEAVRVSAMLGRRSVTTIEVIDGLEVGDEVILSEMTQWESHERVRLN
jgi:HlyD family secretion protein